MRIDASSTAQEGAVLRKALEAILPPERVLDRPVERITRAADASFYRLIPRAVVLPSSVDEVRSLFRLSHEARIPMTFRAAGTSLSGQAVSDGLLVDVARHFRSVTVLENGRRVRVEPGAIGGAVNRILRPYGVRIGPDPASVNTCTLGGILSNNSSGMCCGVEQNAYHTLESLTFLLPSGTLVDTAASDADETFRAEEPALAEGILQLKRELESDPGLAPRIRAKYRTKNTCGYSLNAFLDFERPVDIFRNLLVGAEGTLAFIAEAVLRTVADLPVKYTGLLLFPDLHAACAAIVPLRDAGARALELMDRSALRSVELQPGVPPSIRTLPGKAAGLLVEFQSADESQESELEERARAGASGLTLVEPARFTHDAAEQALLWKVRSGTFPSVGAARKSGTTVLIEDVGFPVERLADAAVDLTVLFARHGYDEAIIFGHAKDGNLHFVVTQSFNDQAEIDRYARFMDDVVTLVVERYDGALKAEHGTGRNMAPFVEAEWGRAAYGVMKRLKVLADPTGLLNPGVLINPDPKAHLANLKPLPTVEEEVDKCIECGYCEPQCPSRELTLTPRQRIVLRREIVRLRSSREDGLLAAELEKDFSYEALDTCAVDGLCATACPVGIDTGQLTKRFRKAAHPAWSHRVARGVVRHFALVERILRAGLGAGHLVQAIAGAGAMRGLTRVVRALSGDAFPEWDPGMPRPASGVRPLTSRDGASAVYFPSCLSRVLGALPGEHSETSLMEALVVVSARAGKPVWIPPDCAGTCCGVPFSSKGYANAHTDAVSRAIDRFWAWSDEGRLPIVVDTSPCTYGLLHAGPSLPEESRRRFDRLRILDGISWAHDELLPRLSVTSRVRRVALHPVCSAVKMNLTPKLERLAAACSSDVTVPREAGCCGFAGDRGFLVPELTASATLREAAEVTAGAYDGHFSSSRTCEIGLTRATGSVYRSYLHLLEEATRG